MTKVNLNYGNETKSDIFPWDIFKSDSISILKYFNDFQNQNFSILWLKRSQTIGKKQNQTSFHETYLNLTAYLFFYQYILKHFNDFQNREFSVLWLKWTETMGMKQNQTFSNGTYSNLMLFFIGRKILKYFNDFYNWHFSVSLKKWAQSSKVN